MRNSGIKIYLNGLCLPKRIYQGNNSEVKKKLLLPNNDLQKNKSKSLMFSYNNNGTVIKIIRKGGIDLCKM